MTKQRLHLFRILLALRRSKCIPMVWVENDLFIFGEPTSSCAYPYDCLEPFIQLVFALIQIPGVYVSPLETYWEYGGGGSSGVTIQPTMRSLALFLDSTTPLSVQRKPQDLQLPRNKQTVSNG